MEQTKRYVEKDVYIAADGREFDSKAECQAYEEQLAYDAEYADALARMDSREVTFGKDPDNVCPIPLKLFVDCGGNMGEVRRSLNKSYHGKPEYRYFLLESGEDARALAVVAAHSCSRHTAENILKNTGKLKYPCVGLYSSSYKYGHEIGTFDKEVALIEKYFKVHGYSIKLQKTGDIG